MKPSAVAALRVAFPVVASVLSCGGESTEPCTSIACAGVVAPDEGQQAGVISNDPSSGAVFGSDVAGPVQNSSAAEDEVCREVVFQSEASPVNVHILVDRSESMLDPVDPTDENSPTRWDAITAGLTAFVSSSQVNGARVGLQFFGLRSDDDFDCNVDNYRVPAVEMGPIEENRERLIAAIANERPGTLTPTAPAVEGALSYAQQISLSEMGEGRPTVLVLASDGLPSQCGPEDENGNTIISFSPILESLERYAEPQLNAAGEPSVPPVRTYVIGMEQLGANAATMARAGGGQAFLVGDSQDEDLQAEFLDALLTIVLKPLDCEIPVPQVAPDTGEVLDYDKIRVQYQGAASGRSIEFPRVRGASSCQRAQAWFYDNPEAPERIFFCPQACETLGAGDLKLELGCEPQLLLR